MTTTVAPTTSHLDTYLTATCATDAPLDAFVAYLRELSKATLDDLAPDYTDDALRRSSALGFLQGTLESVALRMSQAFTGDVAAAPPSGLAECVRESSHRCDAPLCDEWLPPWAGGTCDDENCRRDAFAAFGER